MDVEAGLAVVLLGNVFAEELECPSHRIVHGSASLCGGEAQGEDRIPFHVLGG